MKKKTTLCILFRDETVEIVYIDRSMLGAQIKCMEQLPRDEEVYDAVAERLRTIEKTPGRVLLCLPRDMVMQRTLRYPAMAPAEIANMIQFEASRHVPLPESDRVLGWSSVLSPDQKQVMINLLASREADVRALMARFEEVGVPVDEVVPFSAAVYPVLGNKPTLLVISDKQSVELCFYGEGQLQDSQVLPVNAPGFSSERLVTAARQMAAKHKSWLGMEGVERVIMTGPQPLEIDLETAFGLRVQPLALPELFAAVDHPLVDALAASSAELPPELSLIENADRKVPVSKRTILVASLCTLLAVEVVAWTGIKVSAPAMQRKQVAEEIANLRRRAAPIQRMKDKNREMRKQLYRLDEICSQHVSAMQILGELSELLPANTYLQQASFRGQTLNLRGLSMEPDRLPELLLASPDIDAISRSDIGKKEGDYQSFNISVTMGTFDEDTDI